MTVAEFIDELEERAMRHREMAQEAHAMLDENAKVARMIMCVAQDMHALGLEEAALLARGITL